MLQRSLSGYDQRKSLWDAMNPLTRPTGFEVVVVAWKERSVFRGRLTRLASFPENAALLPGYGLRWHTCRDLKT